MPVPGLRDKEPHQRLKSLVFGKFRNFGKLRNFEKLRSSHYWDICQRFQTSRTLAARADFAAALNTTHRKGGRARLVQWNNTKISHFETIIQQIVNISCWVFVDKCHFSWFSAFVEKRNSKISISIPPNHYSFRQRFILLIFLRKWRDRRKTDVT